jgi:hypothetical protein
MSVLQAKRTIPLWLKMSWTLFLIVWTPLYWQHYGPENFLWFCDLANFLIALSLWIESPLILSSQGVSILVVQLCWTLDVAGRLVFGDHFIGGTEYMFVPDIPLGIRLLSLFHIITPLLVLWAIRRIGYDRRGWILQTGIAWIILAVCYVFTGPDKNINWVWGLFGRPQTVLAPLGYLLLLMAGYPLFIYLPSHLLFCHLYPNKT